MEAFLAAWSGWAVFIGFLITLAIAFWTFYNAQQENKQATIYRVIAVVAAILIIPALIASPTLGLNIKLGGAAQPLLWLSIGATLVAVVAFILYMANVGVGHAYVCPTCGRPLDPSWDHCPYCEPQETEIDIDSSEPDMLETREAAPPEPMHGVVVEPLPMAPARTEMLRRPPPQLGWLVVRTGPRAGKELRLMEITSIGRDAALNDIAIDDGAISRQHAKVRLEEGRFAIYDLVSANGTFVNDEEILKHVLSDKDTVRMGETTFTFMEVREKSESEEEKTAEKEAEEETAEES